MDSTLFLDIKNHYADIGKKFENACQEARKKGCLPEGLWKRLSDEHFFLNSIQYNNEDGLHFLAAALEGLSYGMRCPGSCSSLIIQAGVVMPMINQFGSDALKNKYWDSLISGKLITAQAGSELHGGSESKLIQTKLIPNDKGFILNGTKWSITNGSIANLMLVTAEIMDTHQPVIVAVDSSWNGVDNTHSLCASGVEDSATGQIDFSNVQVPSEFILGKIGDGYTILHSIFSRERLLVGFVNIGVLERIMEEAIEYTDTRIVFNKKIIEHQYIRKRLTDIKCNYEISKLLAYQAIEKFMNGQESSLLASISKFYGANLATDAIMHIIKIFGSYGVQKDRYDYLLASSIASSIGGGTEEVQREEIIKHMYLNYRREKSIKHQD
ncbi:acyl-CoA dehydrogenase [Legionella sp. km535]|uniref:acyl-CoA dehydrogenase family protein n=1 Tax=Legionella sp. km535 TaxID=2498107 RepID=UPI000F8E037F|nr:acyl-CoA dehydrogenase family protein [Legionella sp. km535]RUR16876.1 acyl-CoA dehydrogenase [Legionella sp. km535]